MKETPSEKVATVGLKEMREYQLLEGFMWIGDLGAECRRAPR